MKHVALERIEMTVADLARLAQKGPVILTRKGKPIVAVKALPGTDWESVALANNPRFIELIEESRRSYRQQGGVRLDDICKELGLKTRRTRKKP